MARKGLPTGWQLTWIVVAMVGARSAAMTFNRIVDVHYDRLNPRTTGRALVSGTLSIQFAVAFTVAMSGLFVFAAWQLNALCFYLSFPTLAILLLYSYTKRFTSLSHVVLGFAIGCAPLAAWLVQSHDWRTSLQIIAALVAAIMVPVAMLVRRPPALAQPAPAAAPGATHEPALSVRQALRSAPFFILVLTSFLSCATHSGPIFHTVSYAVTCGIPLMAAVSIYSLEGLAGMGGRLVFGLLGDRFGAARVLVLALLAQAIVVLGYVYARELGRFYTVAALFGFTYAGVMPLFAVIARENFPLRMMGTVIGATTTASSLGMALGPVLGGLIYDSYSSYAWLFIGAFSLGIGAFLSALAFTRLPRRQMLAAAA